MRRPSFKRGEQFVFLRQFKGGIDSDGAQTVLEPGDDVPASFRLTRLRRLYRRGQIAIKDHEWTNEVLAQGVEPAGRKRKRFLAGLSETALAQAAYGLTTAAWAMLPYPLRYLMANTPDAALQPGYEPTGFTKPTDESGEVEVQEPVEQVEQVDETPDTDPVDPVDPVDPEKTEDDESTNMLLGSDFEPSTYTDSDGGEIQLGFVVSTAQENSGLTADEWNDLEDSEREGKIRSCAKDLELTPAQDCMIPTGGGWYEVYKDGVVSKAQGKEAAQAFLDSED